MHPVHLRYLKSISGRRLSYFFRLLDDLDREKRHNLLSLAYGTTFLGKKWPAEFADKETIYNDFKAFWQELATDNTELVILQGIVHLILSYVFNLGDKTSIEDVKAKNIGVVEIMKEWTVHEPTGEQSGFFTDILAHAENLPTQAEEYNELYNYFCDNVLEKLLAK